MNLRILGLGTALPPYTMNQREATELAQQVCATNDEQASLLRVLYRRSGVNSRHTVLPYQTALQWMELGDEATGVQTLTQLGPTTADRMKIYEEHAPPLAMRASRQALDRAELAAEDITHLVTVSCTGFIAPGIDVGLIRGLSMAPTVERVHVGFMGCHGAINGLRVARGLAAADPAARILLCAVELCCIHYHMAWDPKRCVGNAIFADGAAALVVCPEAAEEPAGWRVAATGSCLLPDSTDAMGWTVGDHGFEMVLSPRVPELIRDHLRDWLVSWLDRQGLALADVASWAVHPGGPRILTSVEESLGLERGATAISRDVLSEFGNMSSPTVLFILDRLRQQDAPRPCVALGFGPGLVAEAALLV